MPAAVPTDEIYERYLKKAIAEINELGDELARAGDELRVPVVGSGHPLADVILLKFSPQPSEIQEGVAFFGRSGQAVLKSLQRLHVDPLAVYGTNCLKFGTEDPADAAAWLTRELHIVQPKLVVVMGERAVEFVNDLRVPALRADRRDADRRAPALHAHDRGARHAGHRRVARRRAREDAVLERLQGARPLVGGAASVLSGRARALALAGLLRRARRSTARSRDRSPGPSLRRRRRVLRARRLARVRRGHLARAPARARPSTRVLLVRGRRGARVPSASRSRRRLGANVAKLACFALVGFWFLALFEELWWVALVAVARPVGGHLVGGRRADRATSSRSSPGIFERVAVAFPTPGRGRDRQPRPARRRSSSRSSSRPPTASVCGSAATWLAMTGLPRRDARARLGVGRAVGLPGAPCGLPRLRPPERRPALAGRARRVARRGHPAE